MGQIVQAEAPPPATEPAAQAVCDLPPGDGTKKFVDACVQLAAPVPDIYVPGLQRVQFVWPVCAWNVPAGQFKQVVIPVTFW